MSNGNNPCCKVMNECQISFDKFSKENDSSLDMDNSAKKELNEEKEVKEFKGEIRTKQKSECPTCFGTGIETVGCQCDEEERFHSTEELCQTCNGRRDFDIECTVCNSPGIRKELRNA